jgi:transposase-like protein
MSQRLILRYSACFKRQVVLDLERGRFSSAEEARRHYEIGGASTIARWLREYGKHHLQAKVVRVEKPDEADRIRQMQKRIADLERALGQTQAQNMLHAEYLKLACDALGQEVDVFTKKCDGPPSTKPPSHRG